MQKARTHVAAAAAADAGRGRAASRIAGRLCRGKVMYLSLQCLQWHVKLCSERGVREWEREVGHACMSVCVQSYAHRQLCPCGFSTAFFGPAPVTQIHSEITTRSRVELSSKSAALSGVG